MADSEMKGLRRITGNDSGPARCSFSEGGRCDRRSPHVVRARASRDGAVSRSLRSSETQYSTALLPLRAAQLSQICRATFHFGRQVAQTSVFGISCMRQELQSVVRPSSHPKSHAAGFFSCCVTQAPAAGSKYSSLHICGLGSGVEVTATSGQACSRTYPSCLLLFRLIRSLRRS
jgi:hypothetical protein